MRTWASGSFISREPESITQAILTKKARNLDPQCQTAVIYRRGVRVREIDQYSSESLFDFNLNDLRVDESRNVDDYPCRNAATKAMAKGSPEVLATWMRSFRENTIYWEHQFGGYELKPQWGESAEEIAARKANWNKALELVGDDVVLASKDGPVQTLTRKGYDALEVPETVVRAAEEYGCNTQSKVLSADELDGRESFDPTPDAVAALDWVWDRIVMAGMDDGKARPPIRCFRKVMNGGVVVRGFLRDGIVYINEDLRRGPASNCGRLYWRSLPTILAARKTRPVICKIGPSRWPCVWQWPSRSHPSCSAYKLRRSAVA